MSFDREVAESGKVVIGTRGSQLALWQANWVKSALEQKYPNLFVALSIIKTKGDKILDVPLAKVGGKGLFVKEIEDKLLGGGIDLAVHSMKDMPGEIPEGLEIGAIPVREESRDVLISRGNKPFSKLKQGAQIGTSSLRRGSQLRHFRADLEIVPLRGNLDTRLLKLANGKLDAIVLAAAGVIRLGLEDKISEVLDESIMLPAVGQGALCLEVRKDDSRIGPIVSALDHPHSRTVVLGERAFLNRLEGGCQVPIAAHGHLENGIFSLTGMVSELDGSVMLRETLSGGERESEKIGVKLAQMLLQRGAKKILQKLKADL